jgi:hypothetical protein
VTYPGVSAFCESNTLSATIQHTVTLGVYCSGIRPDDPYFFVDLYFECPEPTNEFDVLIADNLGYNSTSGRYSCSASASFASGSSASSPQNISSVTITTDDNWRSNALSNCYTRVALSNAPVTRAPTVVMNTTSPSLFPTFTPMDQLTSPPTKPPVATAAPILPQETTPTISVQSPQSNNDDSGKVIGGVVGGIAAGIVIMSLIGFFVFRSPVDSSIRPKAEVHNSVADAPLSIPEGTARHDSLLGPAPVAVAAHALATAVPIAPYTNNYTVDYKDQARTVQPEIPAAAVAEVVPFAAVALDTSVASGGSQKPTHPIAPSTNNYNVDYKDQAQTVQPEIPAAAVAEVVPNAAVALDTSVASGGSQEPTQPEPPGRVWEV